jgi:hypothetical protein
MPWVLLFVALALVSLAVLGCLGWRVYREVRALGREVRAAGERMSAAVAPLSDRSWDA